MCPRCLSHARHRLLAYHLLHESDFYRAPLRVLHVAPERCLARRFSRLDNLDYLTADLSGPAVDFHFDLTAIPFENDTFDAVICLHVLEHIEDDTGAFREILRILRPGRWAILQPALSPAFETDEDPTVVDPAERHLRFDLPEHVRIYGRDFGTRLE